MEYLFKQLRFVRNNTIKQVSGLNEEQVHRVPPGFNNNVLWNVGHIILVHEKFAFGLIHEETNIPAYFGELFGSGTKPANWEQPVPGLDELTGLLHTQIDRIEQKIESRLNDRLEKPFLTSAGLELSTVKECLSFLLYHEGMHFASINAIKQQ
ncbi:DinB family protein [Cohnella suwonensis]|uniref:DinB family protein n=1 Tax=Cohnella suwonensis TaxID=696072 RepID=A0ABW0LX18_9BACL